MSSELQTHPADHEGQPMTASDADIRDRVAAGALSTSLLGDVCDRHGRHHQFLPPYIHPFDEAATLAGRAMPVLSADVYGVQKRPFGLLTDALDQLQPGEVYVGGGGLQRSACWGEILTVTARGRGAAGVVIDGWHRDTRALRREHWPIFSRGGWGQDAAVRASIIDYRVGIEVAGVRIEPGDLIVGDADGVIVIPRDLEEEIVSGALAKAAAEHEVRGAIGGGMSSAAAWDRYGVL
jgi:4-hydroxy-4-methyl-2-oxoglutarate aldolase